MFLNRRWDALRLSFKPSWRCTEYGAISSNIRVPVPYKLRLNGNTWMFDFVKSYGNSFCTWCKAIRNRSNEWSFLHVCRVTNRTWTTKRQEEDESDTRFDCWLWASRKRSVVKLQWPNYRCFMKIRIQALVCLRRNASACCDFQVHVQGTLLYSRYPLLQGSRQPPWGWSGGWVIFHFKLKGNVICGDSAASTLWMWVSVPWRAPCGSLYCPQ